MGQPQYCIKCRRADKGNGEWKSHVNWTDEFLTETNENIIKQGRIQHTICITCNREIRKKGHVARKDGKKL